MLPTVTGPVVRDTYGEAEDVLRLAEIDRPDIGADEVLRRVHAAGVDRGVWHLMGHGMAVAPSRAEYIDNLVSGR